MNVRVHRAVADVDGVTGMAILRAIVAGDAIHGNWPNSAIRAVQKSEEAIAKELSGNWMPRTTCSTWGRA